MKLQVTFDVEDDTTVRDRDTGEDVAFVDPNHEMGVTERGFEVLLRELLATFGADDVNVQAVR